jgi:riboflavin synthase
VFTGLVQKIGRVAARTRSRGNLMLSIEAEELPTQLTAGSSVCVNGVCLTVTKPGRRFEVEVGTETLSRTTLSTLRVGGKVNLETPMRASSVFGGHFVTGHVDVTARIRDIRRLPGSEVWSIEVPGEIARYIVTKGSIAVDGISLTVASVEREAFTVALIPHTIESTALKGKRPGDLVNLEADILAKHIERLMEKKRR